MGPILLTGAYHSVVTFLQCVVEAMTLRAMMQKRKHFVLRCPVSQDSVMKESIEDEFAIKLMSKAGGVWNGRYTKSEIIDAGNPLCRRAEFYFVRQEAISKCQTNLTGLLPFASQNICRGRAQQMRLLSHV
jgi:hypothetical protein